MHALYKFRKQFVVFELHIERHLFVGSVPPPCLETPAKYCHNVSSVKFEKRQIE